MKVCLLGNDYKQQLPLLGYGGIETAFEHTCLGINKYFKDKINACVFVPKILNRNNISYDFKIIETEYIESSISGISPVHYAAEIRDIISRAAAKPDIIWSNGSWSVKPLQGLNIPIICTIMDSVTWEDNKYIYDKNVYYRFVSKFLYDYVFKDAETNPYIKQIKSQSFWCYPGFSDDEFTLDVNKEDYILWVAGLLWGMQGKGLDLFIELARRRPDQTFVAYGSYDKRQTEMVDALKKLSREIKNFEFLGPLPRGEEHKTTFKKAKQFAFLTQTTEAFGMTGVEAISKGTPVLGTENGSLPEIYNSAGICTNNFDVMVESVGGIYNYQDVYDYSLKFHTKNEIEFLYNKSKDILSM